MGDHSQKTWKLGKLVSASMLTIHSVHTSVSMNMVNNVRLSMLWPQAFEWIQYLRHSIDHLHNHATGDDVESICRNYAFRIRCFIYAASKSPVVRDSRLRDLDVVKFIAEWWASGNVIRRETDEATQAIVDLNFLLDNEEGTTQFSSTLLRTFGSAENLAHFAVRNAHNALCGRNNGMVMPACYVGVSWLLLSMKDSISQAVLEKGVVSSLLKTMGVLVGLPLYQRTNTLGLALQTLIEVFLSPKCGQLDHSGLPSRNVVYPIQDTSYPRYPREKRATICDQVGSRPTTDFYAVQYGLQCCLYAQKRTSCAFY